MSYQYKKHDITIPKGVGIQCLVVMMEVIYTVGVVSYEMLAVHS